MCIWDRTVCNFESIILDSISIDWENKNILRMKILLHVGPPLNQQTPFFEIIPKNGWHLQYMLK